MKNVSHQCQDKTELWRKGFKDYLPLSTKRNKFLAQQIKKKILVTNKRKRLQNWSWQKKKLITYRQSLTKAI